MRRGVLGIGFFCLLAAALAGCSPYNFSSQVTEFSSGVDKLSTGFNATATALATDRENEVEAKLAAARDKVVASPACDVAVNKAVTGSEAPCLLYRAGGQPSAPSAIEVALGKTRTAIAALQAYSHALAAVTDAADRSAYDAAVGKLAQSVAGLASAAGPTGAAAGGGIASGVNLIGWLVGEGLDYQRFDALKRAVNAVGTAPPGDDTTIGLVTNAIGKGLLLAREEQLTTLNRTLDAEIAVLGPADRDADYRQRLADAEALAASIQALREADPVGTAQQLDTAHQALVKAVNDPSKNIADLTAALSAFSSKAEALQSSLTAGAKASATVKIAPKGK